MVSGIFSRRLPVAALLLTLGMTLSAQAEPGDIKGQDAMGDKNKSANDGWSQAPCRARNPPRRMRRIPAATR